MQQEEFRSRGNRTAMSQLSALLTVRREASFSEYSFSYTDWSADFSHSWMAGLTSSESRYLQDALQEFCQRPTLDLVIQVQQILNHLFPATLLARLAHDPPGSLALVSDEVDLPWEWIGETHTPLFCRCEVTRDLSQRPSSSPLTQASPTYALLGDTLTKQSGIDDELNQVQTLLKESQGKVLNGTATANRQSLMDSLFGNRFSLLHLACPGGENLELGGSLIGPEIPSTQERTGPRWVWFHHFLRPEKPTLPLMKSAARWASMLFAHGCEAFLCNLWSASPTDQRRFSKSVYSQLLQGATLGASLRQARTHLWERKVPLACAYTLFGNSQLRLQDLRPMRVRESTTVPGGLTTDLQLRVLNGSDSGRIIPLFSSALRQRGLILGSSGPRSCDIELDDSLPNQTASLAMHDETLVLTNLTQDNGTVRVNGLSVVNSIALSGWEKVCLGKVELQIESSQGGGLSETGSPPRSFCLELHDGESTRTEWFEDDLVTVGRSQSARIAFSDQAVSRNHALLQRSGDDLLVSRLGQNVVAINGIPTEKAQELEQGDLVQLTDRAFFKVLRIV